VLSNYLKGISLIETSLSSTEVDLAFCLASCRSSTAVTFIQLHIANGALYHNVSNGLSKSTQTNLSLLNSFISTLVSSTVTLLSLS
jgi:hypothetical protein